MSVHRCHRRGVAGTKRAARRPATVISISSPSSTRRTSSDASWRSSRRPTVVMSTSIAQVLPDGNVPGTSNGNSPDSAHLRWTNQYSITGAVRHSGQRSTRPITPLATGSLTGPLRHGHRARDRSQVGGASIVVGRGVVTECPGRATLPVASLRFRLALRQSRCIHEVRVDATFGVGGVLNPVQPLVSGDVGK
jgi:hypothetical protein